MKNFYLIIISFAFVPNLLAQTTPSLKTDSVYNQEQPKVVVFNSVNYSKKRISNPHSNNIKLNLLTPIAGDFVIHYERQINNSFSFEIGPGVTLRDYFSSLYLDEFSNYTFERVYKLGYSIDANLRFYPSGEMEEFYFAPDVRYRRYNSEVTDPNELWPHKEYVKMLDVKMLVGYAHYWDNVVFDFFVGLGMKNRNTLIYKEIETYSSQTGSYTYTNELTPNSIILPSFQMGWKVGFAF